MIISAVLESGSSRGVCIKYAPSPPALLDTFTSNCIAIAITALLVYEWAIGLGKEVTLFWREKVTGATVLFLLNRYAPMAYMLASFSGASVTTDKSCNASVLTSFALDNLQYIPWALFSGLRTYALCGKRWSIAIPVLILSAVPIAINLTHFYWSHGEVVPVWGCQTITVVPDNISLICASVRPYILSSGRERVKLTSAALPVSILPRSSLIVADAVVVTVTWFTTYSSAAMGAFSHRSVPSIAQRLLVNGTIYFVTLLILNALHLTFTLLSIATHSSETSYIISFTEPITAILVSRFMFDLQKAKQRTQHRDEFSDTLGVAPPDGFSRALGSIGSTLSTSDVWRPGPGPASESYHGVAEGRSGNLVVELEPDVFGKGPVRSVILEPELGLRRGKETA
ncbi:hypothetical protein LXA43DRAFT_1045275 [Ganoderma leucocontextum]|nr:hypothetical protein LXA43DRAFT_1045275 [Ganoderma leucocontextum]